MGEIKTSCLIIGSGPAAYTAAVYTGRANIPTVVARGSAPGGQLMNTREVENYPGFEDPILGPDLMVHMSKQAATFGAEFVDLMVSKVELHKNPLVSYLSDGRKILSETMIIATGAVPRYLERPGEKEFEGRGVSYCATCDGFFFRGKEVAVVGGGSAAVEEALFLSRICSKVTLIHRRDKLRAEKILQDRLFHEEKIQVMWNAEVLEILGENGSVNTLRLNTERELGVSAVFIAIGHIPSTDLFYGQVNMDAQRYIVTKPFSTATNVEGVFAAGDVQDSVYRQAVTAAGTGCMAALEVERFLTI